jgi:hypothetical protein
VVQGRRQRREEFVKSLSIPTTDFFVELGGEREWRVSFTLCVLIVYCIDILIYANGEMNDKLFPLLDARTNCPSPVSPSCTHVCII